MLNYIYTQLHFTHPFIHVAYTLVFTLDTQVVYLNASPGLDKYLNPACHLGNLKWTKMLLV